MNGIDIGSRMVQIEPWLQSATTLSAAAPNAIASALKMNQEVDHIKSKCLRSFCNFNQRSSDET
jgi:hypothetical protein